MAEGKYYQLDVKGLFFPLAHLKAIELCNAMKPGDTLCIEHIDPESIADLVTILKSYPLELNEPQDQSGWYVLHLAKKTWNQNTVWRTQMDTQNIQADQVLDTCGLSCPMPLLKTKKVLKNMSAGQILEIIGTDPGSKNDIPEYCNKGNAEFLGFVDEEGGKTRYFVKVV